MFGYNLHVRMCTMVLSKRLRPATRSRLINPDCEVKQAVCLRIGSNTSGSFRHSTTSRPSRSKSFRSPLESFYDSSLAPRPLAHTFPPCRASLYVTVHGKGRAEADEPASSAAMEASISSGNRLGTMRKTNSPKLTAPREGLQLLGEALGLCGHASTRTADAVLVAVDFEHTENLRTGLFLRQECQVGVAVLDTRSVAHADKRPSELISTYNFASGSSMYTAKASTRFLFGRTTIIRPTDVLASVTATIPKDRNVILLGYNLGVELGVLQAIGFPFPNSGLTAVDTAQIATEVLGRCGTLGNLLTHLRCPHNNLHCGGNDAHFTLKASLLLASRYHPQQNRLVSKLGATHPSPHGAACHRKTAKKRGSSSGGQKL